VLARYAGGLPIVLLERGPDHTRFGSVRLDLIAGLQQGVAAPGGRRTSPDRHAGRRTGGFAEPAGALLPR
jgi:hypothetical protein